MNKKELVASVSEKAGMSKKDVESAINALTETIASELSKGGKVQLIGFGTFETVKKSARTGRNPATGEPIEIKACTSPKFKAGKALKDAINK